MGLINKHTQTDRQTDLYPRIDSTCTYARNLCKQIRHCKQRSHRFTNGLGLECQSQIIYLNQKIERFLRTTLALQTERLLLFFPAISFCIDCPLRDILP